MMSTLKNLVDETTNIKNELKTCYTDLKASLVSKGVSCSDNDKILNLINKVNDISLESLGGRRWASGTTNISSATAVENITITHNSGFTPSLAFVVFSSCWSGSDKVCKNIGLTNLNTATIGGLASSYVTLKLNSNTITFSRTSTYFYVNSLVYWYLFE